MADWQGELSTWLAPFMARLGHKARRRMCPLYVAGLIGPGERKSVGPMAERIAPGDYDRLHHFVSDGVWDATPLERELAAQADKLVGGADAYLVIDDTALPKKGTHSVGVAPQYASALGKTANCQTLVSLTLACGCSCQRVGRAIPFVWSAPACPRIVARPGRSRRSRSPNSIG
jgi:SRSO17 transposase